MNFERLDKSSAFKGYTWRNETNQVYIIYAFQERRQIKHFQDKHFKVWDK